MLTAIGTPPTTAHIGHRLPPRPAFAAASSARQPSRTTNPANPQRHIFYAARSASPGLVQQTVQIVASLRSHDLTVFVGTRANANQTDTNL